MEVNYITPTNPALLDPGTLSRELQDTILLARPWLSSLSNEAAATPLGEGKWSPKQVIGHLTDSAVNNLARIVRAQIGPDELPTYNSDAWVDLQHYADRDWSHILNLWLSLNDHIAWVIAHVPQPSLSNSVTVGGTPVTLGFILEDYIAHIRHHFRSLLPPQP